jgi:large subunit ribosomal protein L19
MEETKVLTQSATKTIDIPDFGPGDTIKIMYKIVEGNKTRLQPYEGIVISKKGSGISKTVTVRKLGADGVGVERIFPLYSPNIKELSVTRRGKVRRAKLYYLRDKIGRAAYKIKENKNYKAPAEK